MFPTRRAISLFIIGACFASPAMSAEKLFSQATETDAQLRDLFDAEADLCLHSRSQDVRIVVACKSMMIYGVALNERGWCYGHKNEANAQMDWHRCDKESEHFTLDGLADFAGGA